MQQNDIEKYLNELKSSPLFKGLSKYDISEFTRCFGAYIKSFENGEAIISEQCPVTHTGILLEGSVEAGKVDSYGRRLIISKLYPNDTFGIVIALKPDRISPVSVVSAQSSTALMIPVDSFLVPCRVDCERHNIITRNLLSVVSLKYFELQDRVNCIIRPTLREKILYYLNSVPNKSGDKAFNIPFDRTRLSEYLNADRSAVSRELAAMKRDGIIDYYKNTFKILG